MSGTRPSSQGMSQPSDMLHMQKGRTTTTDLSLRHMGGEHSEGSHHEIDRAEDFQETRNQQKGEGRGRNNQEHPHGMSHWGYHQGGPHTRGGQARALAEAPDWR